MADENHPPPGQCKILVGAFMFKPDGGYVGAGGDNADVNNNFMTSAATRDFLLRASNAHGGLHPEPPPSAVLYSGDRAAADAARANNAIAAQRRRISPGGGEDAAANAAA